MSSRGTIAGLEAVPAARVVVALDTAGFAGAFLTGFGFAAVVVVVVVVADVDGCAGAGVVVVGSKAPRALYWRLGL